MKMYIAAFVLLLGVFENIWVESHKFLTSSVDPCSYCNGEHIACNNLWAYDDDCYSNAQLLPMTEDLRNLLLESQNKYRNLLAGGGVQGYEPAKRMATLRWNVELEYLASLNVLKCYMEHDKCRRTPDFPYVGQNLGYFRWRGYNFTYEEVAQSLITYWFLEYQDASMADIRKYPKRDESLPLIGHFTLLVQERANQVGCAVLTQESDTGINELFLACNYSFTNFITIPVYRAGQPGSACMSGKHTEYSNLCSVIENFDTSTWIY